MSAPMNYGNSLYSNNPTRGFRSSALPLNSSSSNLSYNSLPESGTRLTISGPLPPPRTQRPLYSYSNPSYSNYNGYGSYGSYGSYYNRPMFNNYSPYYQQNYMTSFANPHTSYDASFIQEAQESSREAFAGIEGIVSTFGSVNMMIESTYYALQSSFNAVLSVAENFSRLRLQFSQILSAFALLRTFKWLYRKLLYLIGLRTIDPSIEAAWTTAFRSQENCAEPDGKSRKSSWPMIMFLIVVYAGPFLMWKFLNSLRKKGNLTDSWTRDNGDYYYAIAKYDYKAQAPEELSFSAGDHLKLAPYEKQTDRSWPLASDGKRVGIIPINYVEIKLKSGKTNPPQTLVRTTPPETRTHHNATANSWAAEASQKSVDSSPHCQKVHENIKMPEIPDVEPPSSLGSSALKTEDEVKQSPDKSSEVNLDIG